MLIYVVDATDISRLELNKNELHRLALEYELRLAFLLVLVNKYDCENAMPFSDVVAALDLATISLDRIVHAAPCSAVRGTGYKEAITYILSIR